MDPKLFATLCLNGASPAKVGEYLQAFEDSVAVSTSPQASEEFNLGNSDEIISRLFNKHLENIGRAAIYGEKNFEPRYQMAGYKELTGKEPDLVIAMKDFKFVYDENNYFKIVVHEEFSIRGVYVFNIRTRLKLIKVDDE